MIGLVIGLALACGSDANRVQYHLGQADSFLAEGRGREALIELHSAARLEPGNVDLSLRVAGGSLHSFAEARNDQDQPFVPAFRQGAVAFPLDELVGRCGLPVPNHIKIDVDGIEPGIVKGGRAVLADRSVRSVLVELNTARDDHWEIVDTMLEFGFDYSEEQAQRARRTSGKFAGIGNYVFRR